jgi:hypothetical protein
MQFSEFIQWSFLGLVSAGVYIMWQMKESMTTLNNKIEVLIVKHELADLRINDHESRIRDMEKLKKV